MPLCHYQQFTAAAMKYKNVFRSGPLRVVGVCVWLASTLAAADEITELPAVIPQPASMLVQPGQFMLTKATTIVVPANDPEAKQIAEYIADLFLKSRSLHLPIRAGKAHDGAINIQRLRQPRSHVSTVEAYALSVNPKRATISAKSSIGLRYGGITLWQLLNSSPAAPAIHAVTINDAPRFAWRGVMLDSARHFQSPEFIRHYIDWMALHKLNVLHWHLTDDQAWRLEIKRYPALTKVAAWRVPAGPAAQADIDAATGKPRQYGGFYTQKMVREIVAYATQRGITIVPEIEMPGHASATLAAYPALAATTQPPKVVPADWGIYSNVYNIEEPTFTFLENVLAEVMALFPGKFIHVGGDEVEKTQWKQSPQVRKRMRELGIADPIALQIYFTQRIGHFLQKNKRRLVGWDEILEPGLPASAVVMSWRGSEGALAAASKGYDTVLSPWPTLYLDNWQRVSSDEPPGRGHLISLEDVYRFEPMPDKLTASQQQHVLGLQGNVWTEHIRTESRVGSMTFPRAVAIAELGWSPQNKRDWPDFMRRLTTQFSNYDAIGMPYSDSAFAPQVETHYLLDAARARLVIDSQTHYGDLRFTLDGKDPSIESTRYQGTFTVPVPSELRVAAFNGNRRISRPRIVPINRDYSQRRASQQLKLCTENIALSLEDDAPLQGHRAVFLVDVQNPCWIFAGAELDAVTGIAAAVGQVPFNFQIGDLVKKIQFPHPVSQEGELEVHLDTCQGDVIARLPLLPAISTNAVTALPRVDIAPQTGKHDLCLRFAQAFAPPEEDLLWVLDWFQLIESELAPLGNRK